MAVHNNYHLTEDFLQYYLSKDYDAGLYHQYLEPMNQSYVRLYCAHSFAKIAR